MSDENYESWKDQTECLACGLVPDLCNCNSFLKRRLQESVNNLDPLIQNCEDIPNLKDLGKKQDPSEVQRCCDCCGKRPTKPCCDGNYREGVFQVDTGCSRCRPMPQTDLGECERRMPTWVECPPEVVKTYPVPSGTNVLPISEGGRIPNLQCPTCPANPAMQDCPIYTPKDPPQTLMEAMWKVWEGGKRMFKEISKKPDDGCRCPKSKKSSTQLPPKEFAEESFRKYYTAKGCSTPPNDCDRCFPEWISVPENPMKTYKAPEGVEIIPISEGSYKMNPSDCCRCEACKLKSEDKENSNCLSSENEECNKDEDQKCEEACDCCDECEKCAETEDEDLSACNSIKDIWAGIKETCGCYVEPEKCKKVSEPCQQAAKDLAFTENCDDQTMELMEFENLSSEDEDGQSPCKEESEGEERNAVVEEPECQNPANNCSIQDVQKLESSLKSKIEECLGQALKESCCETFPSSVIGSVTVSIDQCFDSCPNDFDSREHDCDEDDCNGGSDEEYGCKSP